MPIEKLTMPQLGESVTEGTISKWLVSVGDHVAKYEPIAEVMTDKVNAEIPSSYTGKITQIIAGEGDTLSVGEVICEIEIESGTVLKKEVPVQEQANEEKKGIDVQKEEGNKKRYSPAVLRLSEEHSVNLELIQGSGIGGRITRKDVLKTIENTKVAEQNPPAKTTESENQDEPDLQVRKEARYLKPKRDINFPVKEGDIELPVTGIRQAIASKMLKSKQEIPHAWLMMEVDATNLVNYRNSIKDQFKKKEGYNITYFAFFVKAVAQALKEFPQINSLWAGDKIIQKKDINISIAVSTEDALFVPVIKNADEKTLKGIAREIAELAEKVRTGKITAAEMADGSFTINNTGTFGSVQSMGIINYPQAAILQIESIVKRPVVVNNDMIAIRDIVNLCMSLDHRVLDGLICGKFLRRVKEILENVSKESTPIY